MADSQTLIRMQAMIVKTTLSRATIYRKIKEDPEFPKPVPLSEGRMAFVEAEADAYVAKRIAARAVNSTTDARAPRVDRLKPPRPGADPMRYVRPPLPAPPPEASSQCGVSKEQGESPTRAVLKASAEREGEEASQDGAELPTPPHPALSLHTGREEIGSERTRDDTTPNSSTRGGV